MDQEVAPFLLFTEHDLRPDTPQLGIKLELGSKLTENSNCTILVTIQRTCDSHGEPCIFSWSDYDDGYGPSGFILFRHTANGLCKIDIASDPLAAPQMPLLVDGWNQSLREVGPEGRVRFMITLPKSYRKKLLMGAKYELVWPGGEIAIWDWGTKKQHLNQELGAKSPKICLPAAQIALEFSKFGEAEERQDSPPPIAPSERIQGAPKLSVSLECDKIVDQAGTAHVKISVLYEAAPESSPIIFHTSPLRSWYGPREGYRLYRRRGDIWETVEDVTAGGFRVVDDPDVAVNVSQDENFASLQVGQTWTTSHRVEGWGMGILPDDVRAGDLFRYVFKGVEVDWWDWGGKAEHAETIVKLPCFIQGNVVEPKDNSGRPKLVVPASNFIEFTIV